MSICKKRIFRSEAKDFVQLLRRTVNDPWNYVFALWSLSRRMAENTHRRNGKFDNGSVHLGEKGEPRVEARYDPSG
jgi:hypothetical protein